MSHWNNFPACSFMTDFEIVVVQNERARLERESLEQEELNAQQNNQIQDHHGIQQQQQVHDINDTPLEVSVSSTVGPGLLPDNPLTPILPAPPAYTLVQVTPPQPQVELSEMDKSTTNISTTTTDVHNIINNNQNQPQTLSTSTALNLSLGNDSSSSGTYQSFTDEVQDNNSLVGRVLFRDNATEFMTNINDWNVHRTTRTILISAVRPSFQCQAHNEFFICHACQNHPRKIKISDHLWERWGNDQRGDELPFAYNLRGIIDHLTKFHCESHVDAEGNRSRDMIRTVSSYIYLINKDINLKMSKMFCFQDSLPKAPSTSCLNSTWKSNQTHLTLKLSQAYDFQKYNTACEGHLKCKATEGVTEGATYEMDLADTVYCSCKATTVRPKIHASLPKVSFDPCGNLTLDAPFPKIILNPCGNLTLGQRDHLEHPMAEVILDPALNVSPYCTFFDLEEKSIYQSHKTVLCHYKIFQSLPDFPTRTFIPEKPTTRGDTINQRQMKDHQDTSSEDTSSSNNQSGPEQQSSADLNPASCSIPPPAQVRLPPEGKSPPVQPHVHQGQPSAVDSRGSPMKSIVGQGLATAAGLLKTGRPKIKSQWL